jgi:RNA polymerase sigma factor (sigma-70 family)
MSAGDNSTLVADLYRRYGAAIHRRALSLVGDAQEALDITQETFLAYMKNLGNLRGEAAPFTVLYQIATYQSVDRLRRRSRWSGKVGNLHVDEDEGDSNQVELEAATAHHGSAAQVEAAQDLAILTQGEDPQTIAAAMLYFVEGHTTEEVGEVLDLSRKTVGKLLAQFAERARKRKARLDPEDLQ